MGICRDRGTFGMRENSRIPVFDVPRSPQLPKKQFARISKSYIVNTEQIISFDVFNVYLANVELPIGMSFKDDFLRDYVEWKMMKKGGD
jgi:hypothetical protein